jgi:hypothetical protein
MIFAFAEDGTLSVHETEADVQREYEGVDVENRVFSFYNEDGVFLEPVFVSPNRRGKTLGLLEWVASGVYKLVPRPLAEEDSFALALFETSILNPNPWFQSLVELKSKLSQKGVVVEFVAPNDGET